MTIRPALLAAVAASLLCMQPVLAQGISPDSGGASLKHSALKATTFKVGTVVTNLAVLSVATGGLAGGIALTAFMTGASWVIYTGNDYLWDTYSPPQAKQAENQEFDASADVWRNTGKYLTYKPVIASIKLASLYIYTSSLAVMGVFGTASVPNQHCRVLCQQHGMGLV